MKRLILAAILVGGLVLAFAGSALADGPYGMNYGNGMMYGSSYGYSSMPYGGYMSNGRYMPYRSSNYQQPYYQNYVRRLYNYYPCPSQRQGYSTYGSYSGSYNSYMPRYGNSMYGMSMYGGYGY